MISAIMWAIEHPRQGLCTPEDLPHDYVLRIAKPYLGNFVSIPSDWNPLKNRKVYFKENPANHPDEDMWQFKNFVFVPDRGGSLPSQKIDWCLKWLVLIGPSIHLCLNISWIIVDQ